MPSKAVTRSKRMLGHCFKAFGYSSVKAASQTPYYLILWTARLALRSNDFIGSVFLSLFTYSYFFPYPALSYSTPVGSVASGSRCRTLVQPTICGSLACQFGLAYNHASVVDQRCSSGSEKNYYRKKKEIQKMSSSPKTTLLTISKYLVTIQSSCGVETLKTACTIYFIASYPYFRT